MDNAGKSTSLYLMRSKFCQQNIIHIYSCQNKDYKGIDVKIIIGENDPANLHLYEAFYIRKGKPTLYSREECTEFADLLF